MRAVIDALHSPLFRRALLEATLVGVLAGVVGVHVAMRRMSFFVVALSHGTFPGVVAASLVGVSLFAGGVAAAALMIVAVVLVGRTRALDDTSSIGVVLAGAFAVGVLMLSASPGQSRDLSAFLVGQVLAVTNQDIVLTVVVGVALLGVLTLLHKELVGAAFDPAAFSALGYSTIALDVVVMAVAAVALVTAIPAVGTILAVALLTVPAVAARQCTDRLVLLTPIAALIGGASAVVGLAASAAFGIAGGAAIALTTVAAFAICFLGRRVLTFYAVPRVGTARSQE
ncbi:MAG: metal ABC transporter permease [Actinobacteria bacterium]|nr:metal ABC transporter permease [Actinomycetota bacterium]